MKIDEKLAELAGAFAADGSMQKEHLCMWGNIHQDQEYYDCTLSHLFLESFNVQIKLHPKPSNSVYGFYICKREVLQFFHEVLGFPFGSKTYTVEVPKVVLENPSLYASFIRGYADNDGCIEFGKRKGTASLFKRTRNTYPRISITSVSRKVIDQMSDMLNSLDVKHTIIESKIGKKQKVSSKKIIIRGEERLKAWLNKIGFNNPVHSTKVELWEKYGFCPTHTSLVERKQVLNKEIEIDSICHNL